MATYIHDETKEVIQIDIEKKEEWLLCPICKGKTRIKLQEDTILLKFPLFCPKCKQETLVNVKQLNISIIREPDATVQSQ